MERVSWNDAIRALVSNARPDQAGSREMRVATEFRDVRENRELSATMEKTSSSIHFPISRAVSVRQDHMDRAVLRENEGELGTRVARVFLERTV